MRRFTAWSFAVITVLAVGCAPEGEEEPEVSCLQVDGAETCLPAEDVVLDEENLRFGFDDGWIGVYAVARSEEERDELDYGKLAELEELFPEGPEQYLGWGIMIFWIYDVWLAVDDEGELLVMTGWIRIESGDETRYVMFWGFWRDIDRDAFVEQAGRFAEATEIVDWD